MVCQTNLLLCDVELLDIENHLLLKAIIIDLHTKLCNTLTNTLTHSIGTSSLKRCDSITTLSNIIHTLEQVGDKNLTFLNTESIQALCCEVYSLNNCSKLLIRYTLTLYREYIRHTQHSRDNRSIVYLHSRALQRLCYLIEVCTKNLVVNHATCLHRLALEGDNHIYLTAHQRLSHSTAHLKLGCTIRHRHLYREV